MNLKTWKGTRKGKNFARRAQSKPCYVVLEAPGQDRGYDDAADGSDCVKVCLFDVQVSRAHYCIYLT